MASIQDELIRHTDAIVQRWYEAWRKSPHRHPDLDEAVLKNSLPLQLRLIGEQLQEIGQAERPRTMWKIPERLDPEARVAQEVPIEEVVQEYAVAVDTVREWLEERAIDVPFRDYSYFYAAMFELAAEAVRRYARHQADVVRKARAHYLASIMHQLRTPLGALSAQVELLDLSKAPDSAATARLRRNVRRIQQLVDSILRLDRFQTSEVPVRPAWVSAAQLIDDIMSDYAVDAERKNLRFEARVDRNLRIFVDPGLFTDALGNLVQNAVKYTRQGFVVLDAEATAEEVVFHVRDSGPGIAPQQQRTLFEENQPASMGGIGIGLRIARQAARAQGGNIDVESKPGAGSVFSLRMPREVAERTADVSADNDQPPEG